MDLFHDSSW